MEKNGCGKDKCKYHFGNECFKTIADLRKWAMPNNPESNRIVDEVSSLYEFLCLSLEAHPERGIFPPDTPDHFYKQKRGGGDTGEWEHYGWQPGWPDGVESKDRFSYKFIFEVNPDKFIRLKLLRDAIREQMDDVRWAAIEQGLDHVHHEPPFLNVVNEWLKLENITLLDIEFKRNSHGRVFASDALMERWEVFHAHNTTLTAMSEAQHYERHREMKKI
mgnify:FL=1|tara:strand:+ start:1144 stop:1800 length:657 start_codon:yes stop_codon:yes gene_type:complete